jgi:hypothetical protein
LVFGSGHNWLARLLHFAAELSVRRSRRGSQHPVLSCRDVTTIHAAANPPCNNPDVCVLVGVVFVGTFIWPFTDLNVAQDVGLIARAQRAVRLQTAPMPGISPRIAINS